MNEGTGQREETAQRHQELSDALQTAPYEKEAAEHQSDGNSKKDAAIEMVTLAVYHDPAPVFSGAAGSGCDSLISVTAMGRGDSPMIAERNPAGRESADWGPVQP